MTETMISDVSWGHSMMNELRETLPIYQMPGQSLWRAFELEVLRELKDAIGFERPILELGCGDGHFTRLLFEAVDDAIDVNPRAVERCRRSSNIYGRVQCMDARDLTFDSSMFGTAYANCVLEHIPQLNQVLSSVNRVLRPDGKLVTTVPLNEMNNHLLLRSKLYADHRRRQLSHVNLLSKEEWIEAFYRAGFARVEAFPYLSGANCRMWDWL